MSETPEPGETDPEQDRITQWSFLFFITTLMIGLLMAVWMLISSTFF